LIAEERREPCEGVSRLFDTGRLRSGLGFRYDSASLLSRRRPFTLQFRTPASSSINWTKRCRIFPAVPTSKESQRRDPRGWRPRSSRSVWPPSRDTSMRPR
jgi:hypothetical protein